MTGRKEMKWMYACLGCLLGVGLSAQPVRAQLATTFPEVDRLFTEFARIAAENLFLDQAKDRRRKALDDLHAQVGACTPGSGFDEVENALRGTWTMPCERGTLRVTITLAPTMPPTVQFLSVTPAPAAPPRTDACPAS